MKLGPEQPCGSVAQPCWQQNHICNWKNMMVSMRFRERSDVPNPTFRPRPSAHTALCELASNPGLHDPNCTMCVRMLQGCVFGPCRKATTAVLEGQTCPTHNTFDGHIFWKQCVRCCSWRSTIWFVDAYAHAEKENDVTSSLTLRILIWGMHMPSFQHMFTPKTTRQLSQDHSGSNPQILYTRNCVHSAHQDVVLCEIMSSWCPVWKWMAENSCKTIHTRWHDG